MFNNKTATVAGGAALGLFLAVASMGATSTVARTTHFTFSRSVGLPGVTLGPGGYIVELADPGNDTGLVRVMNANRSRVYFMGFTQSVPRPAGLSENRLMTFREAQAGVASPIDVWYPQDERTGHRFIYPDR